MVEKLSLEQVLVSGVGAFMASTLLVIAAVGTPAIRSSYSAPTVSAVMFSYA